MTGHLSDVTGQVASRSLQSVAMPGSFVDSIMIDAVKLCAMPGSGDLQHDAQALAEFTQAGAYISPDYVPNFEDTQLL